jgi:hypothetical protein
MRPLGSAGRAEGNRCREAEGAREMPENMQMPDSVGSPASLVGEKDWRYPCLFLQDERARRTGWR